MKTKIIEIERTLTVYGRITVEVPDNLTDKELESRLYDSMSLCEFVQEEIPQSGMDEDNETFSVREVKDKNQQHVNFSEVKYYLEKDGML